MYRLFADSDSDITPSEAKEWGYELISMPYIVGDKVIYPYKDFDNFNSKEFYDMLRTGVIPTTSALNIQEYIDYFEPVFASGEDIVYVHFSAAMTATFDFMHDALKELQEKYPERKFYEIDCMGITIGSYIMTREIGLMHKAGASLEEILEFGKNAPQHFACYFFADDLKFFKRSGRVSGLAAIMGSIIGIKPIININEKGVMGSVDKTRGKINALEYLVNVVKELGTDLDKHTIIIGHTDALDYALELEEMLQKEFDNKLDIKIVVVNPTAGSHCGPSSVGLAFYAKHR